MGVGGGRFGGAPPQPQPSGAGLLKGALGVAFRVEVLSAPKALTYAQCGHARLVYKIHRPGVLSVKNEGGSVQWSSANVVVALLLHPSPPPAPLF